MKKLLGVIAGLFVTVAAVAAFTAASDTALAASCTNGTKYTDFDGSRSGNTLTVWPKKKLCKDVKVNFTTFKVLNKNYNGKPFKNNPTALPQSSIWNKTVTLKKGSTSKVSVAMQTPDACTPYQIDAYIGPVQTKVTTSAGLKGTTAIVAKLFDKTKSDCTVVKNITVCDLATKKVITIKETQFDARKHSKNLNDCKTPEKVKACNTETGVIEMVEKGKENVEPYTTDLSECEEVEMVKACNTETGIVEDVEKGEENTPPHTTDLTKCEKPEMVEACNTETGVIEEVEKGKENTAPHTTDLSKCDEVKVCDEDTGEIITVPKADEDKYGPVDSDKCQPKPPVTPEELPTTGPAEALSALVGVGAVAGTTTSYIRSRRALRK